jgi:hypothetical protein
MNQLLTFGKTKTDSNESPTSNIGDSCIVSGTSQRACIY